MQRNATYVLGFATVVCVVCAVVVSSTAVALKDLQTANANAYRQQNVLAAAGLLAPDEDIDQDEIERRFERIETVAIDLATGAERDGFDVTTYDQRRAAADPSTSRPAPDNAAQVQRLPEVALVYEVRGPSGELEMVVLPVSGKGLWSTLYGYIALDGDLRTIRGITFYEHLETPGLGGEVDNPRWKSLWDGRMAFDEDQEVAITVIKGRAGPPSEDPYRVDGLSGATITSRGVTNLVHFWLGPDGFGTYLERLGREG